MSSRNLRPELYFAVNLRADGPIPGLCSVQLLEMTIVGESRDGQVRPLPPHLRNRFQIEMRPLGRPFESSSQSWLSSESQRLAASGVPVGEAMVAASGWVRNVSEGRAAVPVTWPGGVEGVHLQHYFSWRGDGATPFTRSQVANNIELVNVLLGEDRSMIAGLRSRTGGVETAPAPAASRNSALTGAVNLLSVFR
jgi:hypothetical protein